jgi:hypothetical protein
MPIITKVLEKKKELTSAPNKTDVAEENRRLAINAIHGGVTSTAWKTYMERFVDKGDPPALQQKQLMRLLATDGTINDDGFRKRRAYMISNATCGEPTGPNFDDRIEGIDDGI